MSWPSYPGLQAASRCVASADDPVDNDAVMCCVWLDALVVMNSNYYYLPLQ